MLARRSSGCNSVAASNIAGQRLGASAIRLLLLLVLLTRLTDEKLPRTRRMALFWQKCGAVSGGSIDLCSGPILLGKPRRVLDSGTDAVALVRV